MCFTGLGGASPGSSGAAAGTNRIAVRRAAAVVFVRSHSGVASKMFGVLAKEGINIMMISTSEIKISCIIDAKYTELAVRSLHDAFELDKGDT